MEHDITAADLTDAEVSAIRMGVDAVVRRDLELVRELIYAPWREQAESFWTWADEYGDTGRLDLVMPPGDVRDWEISLYGSPDDDVISVDVEMWAAGIGRTDLTLELELDRHRDGRASIVVRDMHVQ